MTKSAHWWSWSCDLHGWDILFAKTIVSEPVPRNMMNIQDQWLEALIDGPVEQQERIRGEGKMSAGGHDR